MVAWGLAAPETNLCRGSTKQLFFIQYAEHLFMAAPDHLYQFCDFYLSFAKILQSQKQEMQILYTYFHFLLKFLVIKFLILESVQRFSRDLLHK